MLQENVQKYEKIKNKFVQILGQNGVSTEDFGSNETLRAEKSDEDLKKVTTIHSTPTSTLDDGYESSNSTPLVSGNSFILPLISYQYFHNGWWAWYPPTSQRSL